MNFCCLVKIGVSIKDLSDIYCISRTSVSRKKQRVKKDKFGLTADDETLDSFCGIFRICLYHYLVVCNLYVCILVVYMPYDFLVLSMGKFALLLTLL